MNAYAISAEKALGQLGSSKDGLSTTEAKARLAKYGPNAFAHKKTASLLSIFLSQFKSLIVLILLVAVVISAALGEVVDAAVIAVIVVFNAVFGTVQEFRAEKAMEALAEMASPAAKVIRD